jgi:hypothetical protein
MLFASRRMCILRAGSPIPLIKRADGILKSKLVTSITNAVKDFSMLLCGMLKKSKEFNVATG